MATFDELYLMQQGQNNPLINLQQIQARLPNWLSAPTPPNTNTQAVQGFANTMQNIGRADREQQNIDLQAQRLEDERERARSLADIQMQTFSAKQAQLERERQNRANLAGQEGVTPMEKAAIQAGHGGEVVKRRLAPTVSTDPYTDLGKIAADERAGFLTPEQANARRENIVSGEKTGLDTKDRAGIANTLRDDFNRSTDQFKGISDNYQNISNASNNAIGDVARTYSLLKLFDPGAAVQEGDKANVDNAGGVPSWVRNLYNQSMGKGIDPTKRLQIAEEAGKIYNRELEGYQQSRERYEGLGVPFGIAPEAIAPQTQYERHTPLNQPVQIGGKTVTRISD